MTSEFFKKLICVGSIGLSSILAACSTTGYQTASHNGKYYWFPENCKQFNYYPYDTDTIYCFDKGVPTGVSLTPANLEDVRVHQQQKAQEVAQLNQSLQNLGNSYQRNRPTTTNCMNLGFGQVTCTSY